MLQSFGSAALLASEVFNKVHLVGGRHVKCIKNQIHINLDSFRIFTRLRKWAVNSRVQI